MVFMSGGTVSVVISSMNEERTIGTCITAFQKEFQDQGLAGEIMVDDSWTDRTPEIARPIGALVVCPASLGNGNAQLKGLCYANGE